MLQRNSCASEAYTLVTKVDGECSAKTGPRPLKPSKSLDWGGNGGNRAELWRTKQRTIWQTSRWRASRLRKIHQESVTV